VKRFLIAMLMPLSAFAQDPAAEPTLLGAAIAHFSIRFWTRHQRIIAICL